MTWTQPLKFHKQLTICSTRKRGTRTSSYEDLELIQRKSKEVEELMSTSILDEKGQGVFASDDFDKLLEERDGYLEVLKKAGIRPEQNGTKKNKSRCRSKRPGMPRPTTQVDQSLSPTLT
jgi:hypothetical protein